MPPVVYENIMRILKYQRRGITYGIPCDKASLDSYPNLTFAIDGVNFNFTISDYIYKSTQQNGLCVALIDVIHDDDNVDYRIPNFYLEQICKVFNKTT
ncbi:hypothetical protein M3Y98_01208200 [Aphelenchoides besseyi]|nr:hypothetical protein M3Y98_01208200 [Aphelenchoides besseyi]